MNKEEKQQVQDATVYRIEKAFGKVKGVYRVSKRVIDEEVNAYHVTVKPSNNESVPLDLWCDCPGFRRQKFPQIEHKHVRMALHYQSIGEPVHADYKFTGTGRNTIIQYNGRWI